MFLVTSLLFLTCLQGSPYLYEKIIQWKIVLSWDKEKKKICKYITG